MRRFFFWLFNHPTHEQQTISRLLDMYERLLDRTLESWGLEGVREVREVLPAPASSPSLPSEISEREVEERAMIEEYAVKAAMSPELFEQAEYNAQPGNHPDWERWKKVVKRAEEMGVLVS